PNDPGPQTKLGAAATSRSPRCGRCARGGWIFHRCRSLWAPAHPPDAIVPPSSQPFTFDLAATTAGYPAHRQLQVDAMPTTGQVADQAKLLVVEAPMPSATNATGRFFWLRRNVTMRTQGSPKTPRTVLAGTNPENR